MLMKKSVIFVACLLIAFFFIFGIISVIFYVSLIHYEGDIPSNNTYQITEFDKTTNRTMKRMIRISRKLKPEEYITFKNDESGSYSVISKFLNRNYKCTGECYCENEKLERRNVGVVAKSMYFVVAAFSTVMAINIATEYFKDQCSLELPICMKELGTFQKIRLQDCSVDDVDEEIIEAADVVVNFEFECEGHCVKSPYKFRQEINHDCEKLTMERTIWVEVFTLDVEVAQWVAKEKFQKLDLAPFCRKSTVNMINFDKDQEVEYMDTDCTGVAGFGAKNRYKNVECTHTGEIDRIK